MRLRTGFTPLKSRPNWRHHFLIDRLDPRLVLSSSSLGSALIGSSVSPTNPPPSSPHLSVISTTPANSTVLTSSPSMLQVNFDRPIDVFSLGNKDFALRHLANDGSTSPLLPGETLLSESVDPDGNQIDLTLSRQLAEGEYELILNAGSQLQGVDGSSLAVPGSDMVLSEFGVSLPGAGLDSATDLKTIVPEHLTISGQLGQDNSSPTAQYYKFTVSEGHHWRVGVQVSPLGDASTLDARLTLLDSQGQPIATGLEASSNDPNSPYLFAGLNTGTYYVEVSLPVNAVDASGSSNPDNSAIGLNHPGGPFQLDLVADIADQPSQVVGFRVDQADPLSTDPTGLTLQFSAAMNVAGIDPVQAPPLTLVDQSGKSWPLLVTGYQADTAQLTLAFEQTLAPGTYSVEVPTQNGLLDLAGQTPVAAGLPAGTLGMFVVSPSQTAEGDLGTIRPGPQGSGIASTLDLQVGQTATRSFVASDLAVYEIEGIDPSSGVRFAINDASGHVLATGPEINGHGTTLVDLSPGVYQIVFSGGPQSSSVSFQINEVRTLAEVFLTSGVSQGPALNVRLVNPTTSLSIESTSSTIGAASTPPSVNDGPSSNSLPSPAHPTSTEFSGGKLIEAAPTPAFGVVVPLGPTLTGLASSVGLLGRPSSTSNMISVVGTSGPSNLTAIASNAKGISTGLGSGSDSMASDISLETEFPVENPSIQTNETDEPVIFITLEGGVLSRDPGSDRADDRSFSSECGMNRLVAKALEWLESRSRKSEEPRRETASTAEIPAGELELPTKTEMPVETASISPPLGLGLVCGLGAYHYGRKHMKTPQATSKEPHRMAHPTMAGPHRRHKVRVR